MAATSRREAATIAVARGSRLGRAASAGSATMTGISGPRPWRSASASANPANAPPPMTMLRCADIFEPAISRPCHQYIAGRNRFPKHPSLPARIDRTESAAMSKGLIDLISVLDLEPLEVNLFRGNSPKTSWQRVFGGQVIGQAMVAACRTVEGRLPHSLHCYFILPGDPKIPIIYQVERLRDGKSYSTRRVTAIQHGNAIFSIMVSFHVDEPTSFDHQDKMPDVPPPEKLTAEEMAKQPMFRDMPEFIRRYYESDRPIELRPVEIGRYFGQKIEDGRIHVWIRTAAKLPDDPALHMCALAYASDFSLLDAAMARYGRTLFDKRMMPGILTQAMCFHPPFRADEWLRYAQHPPSAQVGRGLTRGSIFKPVGTLVASVAQEGSVRERR